MTLLSVTWSSCSRTHRWQLVEGLQQQSFSSHSGMDHGANRDFPGRLVVKNMPCQCGRCKRCEFDSWVGKIPWSRKWQPTPVFLPGDPMDRGAWWATVHGVTKSWTQLSNWAQHQGPDPAVLALEGEVLSTGPPGKSPKITLTQNNPCVKVTYLGHLALNLIACQ